MNFLGTFASKLLVPVSKIVNDVPVSRCITNCSIGKGKQKTSSVVKSRFFRLNWGIWIRTKAGRDMHLWKKSEKARLELRQHVFVNATQTRLLDRMVSPYWRRPRYWVDDPYQPYQERNNFWSTRKKPLP
ncbi:unnamed protein product [Notodromas monacha]|uniref:Large ribosomal subunit protein bL35m n=1 Tax=Notodromas monacha TaxID=399045 RepID=A0A7R9BJB0_9CRUS|nr:unnamed protein product [Notodromas monacha]CAG0915014.1 unnamed protein product [Notodromas monacha]